MKEEELDRVEREAIEAIERIKLEYKRAAAPYAKIIADVRTLRPRVWRDEEGRLMVPIMRPADEVWAVLELTDNEKRVIREALWRYQSFCYERANEIAQDRSGRTKAEWVGMAQDEGKVAGDLLLRLSDRVLAREGE